MYAKNLIFPGAGIQLLCSTVSVILDKLKYFDKSYVFIIFISDQSLSKLITNHSYTLQVYSTSVGCANVDSEQIHWRRQKNN